MTRVTRMNTQKFELHLPEQETKNVTYQELELKPIDWQRYESWIF